MMEQLKYEIKDMMNTVRSCMDKDLVKSSYNRGCISAFEWVLEEIDKIMSK